MRVLILTPSLPYPPIWGFGMRVYQLLKHLSTRHQVSLLTYAESGQEQHIAAIEALGARVCTVPTPHPGSGFSRRFGQLASLASSVSFQSRALYSAEMQAAIYRLLDGEPFDVVQIESSQMSCFDFGRRAVVLLDEHNIEYELLNRMCRTEGSPIRKLFNWLEYQKFRREEQGAWVRSAGCMLTSGREQGIVRQQVPGKATAVVPNGVDIDYFQPADAIVQSNSIVFTGLMRYRPNIDAVIYMVREILPHLLRKRPNLTFTVVGAGEPEEVKRLAGPNVVVTGAVPDVRPHVADAAVFAVPLRMGSGTRLKVLEGLAMGKPLVSTALGCEGISVRDGQHLLIADEPSAFARSVLQLLDDAALASRLARNGRGLVESEYSWASVAERLELFYEEVLRRVATAA